MNPMLWSFTAPAPFRIFFALRPPPPLRPKIASFGGGLKAAHRLRGRVIGADRVHNTLALAYDMGETWNDHAARAARAAAALRQPSFPVRFEWTESFVRGGTRYPLVMRGGLRPLCDFQRALAEEMRRAGFAVPRSYTPHITLLWGDHAVGDHPMRPVGWTVKDFVLIQSFIGQSRHVELGHWRLH